MNLELLSNETILDLFEYIPIYDLFHSFFNLNSRFNQLLCVQFRKFHLDLRLLSKTKFDQICENYVPLVINRIISFHLADDNNTPQQIERFLSQQFQLRQFTHLQSITLTSLQIPHTLDQIMNECSYLPRLTHLTFTNGYMPKDESDVHSFFNHIWSLKSLFYCYLDILFAKQNDFPHPTVISTSIKHLIIPVERCYLRTLGHLCQQAPNLEYLSIRFVDRSNQLESILPIRSIIRLNIDFAGSIDKFKQLLQNLPNLRRLTCRINNLYINGYEWEEIIRQYLPKLQILRFRMNFSPLKNKDKESQLNEIIDTYRTKFWIDEHRWFVRCHWCASNDEDQFDDIYLFTLPYTFSYFSGLTNCIGAKSTDPSDDGYLRCPNVNYLYYDSLACMSSISYRLLFSNIEDLRLTLPFDDEFLLIVPKLDRLTSLYVIIKNEENLGNIQSQLQLLMDGAVHLRSLSFDIYSQCRLPLSLMEIMSASVHELSFNGYTYEEKECIQLAQSSLGKQCETLWIEVRNRINIVGLVNNMPNLQALTIQCKDDSWTVQNDSIQKLEKDELVEWLHQQLSPTYIITSDLAWDGLIRIWIR